MKKFAIITAILMMMVGCSASSSADAITLETVSKATSVEQGLWKPSDVNSLSWRQMQTSSNTGKVKSVTKKLEKYAHKTPYVFSGDTPRGWDCSGLVVWTYKQLGIDVPHSATAQAYIGKQVRKPKVGDIVVFGYKGSKYYDHAGIYIGNGKVINANRFYRTTVIEPLSNFSYYSNIRFIRVVQTY